jgi:2'-5' RNA ligase
MYAIISVLDPESSKVVNDFWRQLCLACGLDAIYAFPLPHFSWLLAEELKFEETVPILSKISARAKQMTLHTFGIGIFTGKKPVLYLPLVKTNEMIRVHKAIWQHVEHLTEGAKQYYSPKLWVPHITLALNDLNQDNLACAINKIAFEPIELFVRVDNLAIVQHEDDDKEGQSLAEFHLSGD